jgi:hypothetical protein
MLYTIGAKQMVIYNSLPSFEGASWEYLEEAIDWNLEDGNIKF